MVADKYSILPSKYCFLRETFDLEAMRYIYALYSYSFKTLTSTGKYF